jgi:hypothetical protein
MKNHSEIVMAAIDVIMRDCAKGVFNDEYAIVKIHEIVQPYILYREHMAKINMLKADILELKKSLSDMEDRFDSACQERDKVMDKLNLRIDEVL